jgi:hypothetical protein
MTMGLDAVIAEIREKKVEKKRKLSFRTESHAKLRY